MSTLKRSERNSIIEDYRNGVLNPNYEVIQTKTKGRYTVRKRKVPLTDEQLEQLNDITTRQADDDIDHVQSAKRIEPAMSANAGSGEALATGMSPSGAKRSKKENALFDLQNQLNTQMLYRLNELTNKVTKLKAWKKKMKTTMYEEEDDDSFAAQQQPIGSDEALANATNATNAMNISEAANAVSTNAVSVSVSPNEQDVNSHQYLEQIPQQYMDDSFATQSEMEEANGMSPTYLYGARGGIDYSKFGF